MVPFTTSASCFVGWTIALGWYSQMIIWGRVIEKYVNEWRRENMQPRYTTVRNNSDIYYSDRQYAINTTIMIYSREIYQQ